MMINNAGIKHNDEKIKDGFTLVKNNAQISACKTSPSK